MQSRVQFGAKEHDRIVSRVHSSKLQTERLTSNVVWLVKSKAFKPKSPRFKSNGGFPPVTSQVKCFFRKTAWKENGNRKWDGKRSGK